MSFDWVAPYYDTLARLVFGRSIRRAQCCYLNQIPSGARVLVVGGGTGWLLTELLRKPEVAHVTYLEASARMLAMARQRVERDLPSAIERVRFVHGTEHQLAAETGFPEDRFPEDRFPEDRFPEGRFPEDRFSVIITNFVLDMYEGEALDRLIQTLAKHLTADGLWLFTDFRLSGKKQHRAWQRMMIFAMYAFFRLTAGIARQRLPPYHRHFTKHGFRMAYERSFYGDFMVSRVYRSDEPIAR